jgi:hypothetical protein
MTRAMPERTFARANKYRSSKARRGIMSLKLIEQNGGVRLTVKAVPGSSRDRIVAPLGEALKIAVSAAPQRGAPNQAILALLAERLGIHPSLISITRGQTSPRKELFIARITGSQVRSALERP